MRRHSIVLRVGLMSLLGSVIVEGAFQDFALQVGPPVAGSSQPAKKALLVVRPAGCADPARAQITATAEGLVNGNRQTVPLTVSALPTPGVHAVPQDVPTTGFWIVNLVGNCDGTRAGAIVTMGPKPEYRREAVKLLKQPATETEIDASLKALATGGHR